MDTLVIDIEGKQNLSDVGGKEFLLNIGIAVVGVYSYAKNEYVCFSENEFAELKERLTERAILVGFSANKFDFPLLSHHLELNLNTYPRIDISDEIEQRTGRLIGLGQLAHLNLGMEKAGQAVLAPALYNEGRIEELKLYCLQDVKITKELFDRIKQQGFVLIPKRDGEGTEKVSLTFDTSLGW